MDTKWVALGLYGLVAFQLGADPEGTQGGIAKAFTSANTVAHQVPILFQGTGAPTGPPTSTPGSGYDVISLPDGRQVQVPAGYRIVPTGS